LGCFPTQAEEGPDLINAQQYAVQLPPGLPVPIILQEPVSTETAHVGQPFWAVVGQDIYMDTRKVLGRNDRILGVVETLEQPIEGRNAILKIRFKGLRLSTGVELPLEAYVETGKDTHSWGGELTEGTQPVVVPYNVYRVGTYGRVMYRGPRKVGNHISLLPGERYIMVLESPVDLYALGN